MSAAASSQDFGPVTLRAGLALDFRNWHFRDIGHVRVAFEVRRTRSIALGKIELVSTRLDQSMTRELLPAGRARHCGGRSSTP
jgi:hypothetical protein